MAQRIADLEKMLSARDEQINELKANVSHYQSLAEYFEGKYLNAVEWSESYYIRLRSVERKKMILQNKLVKIQCIVTEE